MDFQNDIQHDGAYEDAFIKHRQGLGNPIAQTYGLYNIKRIWSILPWAAASGIKDISGMDSERIVKACARAEQYGSCVVLEDGSSYRQGHYQALSSVFEDGKFRPNTIKIKDTTFDYGEYLHLTNTLDRVAIDRATRLYLKAIDASVSALERSQQPIHKIPNLGKLLSTPTGSEAVMKRIELVDSARNIRNTVVIDSEEDYTILNNQMTSAESIISSIKDHLSAVSGIPKRILFGDGAGGLNSGSSDIELWNATIRQYQITMVSKVYQFVFGNAPEFNAIGGESANDRMNRLQIATQALNVLLINGVWDNEEARRFLEQEGFTV